MYPMLIAPLAHGSAQGSTHCWGHGMQIGACSTHMGALIMGALIIGALTIGCEYGTATGVAIGVPMARGAPSTAGATVVPQGEPL